MTSRRAAIFILFVIAYFLSYFFRSANAVIAGDLTRDLSLTAAQLGLMTSLFYASFALVQLPLGAGLDRYGPRWVTPGLMLIGVVGSLLFASARSFAALAAGRALIGIGMAGVLMGALKAFGHWYPPKRLATISGFMVGLGALGGLFAATPLAWLNGLFGWRAIFTWGALAILLSAAAIMAWARNTPPGIAWHADSAAGGGFGQIFRDIRFWRIAPLNFSLLGAMLAVQGLWGGPYLTDVIGMSEIEAGNPLLAMGAGVAIGYFACGWLADRYGARRVMIIGTIMSLLCQSSFVLPIARPLSALFVAYFAFGLTGALNIVLLAQIRMVFPPTMSGRAVTAINLFGIGGTALIQWWMGLIINLFARDQLGRYPATAYVFAFGFTLVCTGLALAWYAPLRLVPPAAFAPSAIEAIEAIVE